MQGKLISRKNVEVNDTVIREKINTDILPNGQYIIALQSDYFTTSRKIAILHP